MVKPGTQPSIFEGCDRKKGAARACAPSLSFRKLSEPRAEPFCRRRPDGPADTRITQRQPIQNAKWAHVELLGSGHSPAQPGSAAERRGRNQQSPGGRVFGSAPRPGREPSRATDSAPAARGTANALKICAARAHRAPTFSRCEGRVDLGLRTPDFHVRNPRINCKRTRAIEQNIPDFFGFQIQNFLIFICVFFCFRFLKKIIFISEILFFYF